MKKISEYETKESMRIVFDDFENMVNEEKRIQFVKNFEYELALEFLETREIWIYKC